jgi:ribosomal protein S18 acetylase RimI-like enzyme
MAAAVARRHLQLRDGRLVLVRPVEAGDAAAIVALCERLSPTSSLQRFFTPGRRLSEHEARNVAEVDHVRCETLVALDAARLVALGSLQQLGDDPHAELTLVVEDAYQGQGLGRQMLAELISAAVALGFSMLWVEVLPDNTRVLRLLETAGLEIFVDPYFGLTRVLVYLQS